MSKKEDTPEYTIHYHVEEEEPVDLEGDPETEVSQYRRRRTPARRTPARRPGYYVPPRRRIYYPPRYVYGCPAGTTAYYVQYGDTVWGIAEDFNVDIDDLIAANPGMDPENLDVGERICIPR
jgi:hypothetical protein